MANFYCFQHYPHSLLDPLLIPTSNSTMNLSGYIDQNPRSLLPNSSTTSLDPFLNVYISVEKTESCAPNKRTNTTKTENQVSRRTSTTTANGKPRRRKARNVSNSKEEEGRKRQKQKNGSPSCYVKEKRGKEEEPPRDYIHVRARRGQATDRHSLAERVRREKISERMKILQKLVPSCDKVTGGKVHMLDEIINYVQSLQNQVEFLSMKLASINPVYDFGLDLDGLILRPEEEGEEREMFGYTSGFQQQQLLFFT